MHFQEHGGRACSSARGADAVGYGDNFILTRTLQHALRLVGADDALYRERLHRLYSSLLSRAVDGESGGVYAGGSRGLEDRREDYATQAAALVGLLQGYRLCGEEVYLEKYALVHRFMFERFFDGDLGECRAALTESSRPGAGHLGDPWKTPYHTVEALLAAESLLLKLTL